MVARGYLVLEGGAEFSGHMKEVDRRALVMAGGADAAVDIIPAAAAPDNNHHRAGGRGVAYFKDIGARNVVYRLVIDHTSAQDRQLAEQLFRSRLIYILGGFPAHLALSLRGTKCWQSIRGVYESGGVIAGSSAGAMVLCEHFYDPLTDKILAGLNLMPNTCIIPHYNTAGSRWVECLLSQLPGSILLGIDEQTGLINDVSAGGWTVYGAGCVVLHRDEEHQSYAAGQIISYEALPLANDHRDDGLGDCSSLPSFP